MKLVKSLLLGTAAGFAAITGAQAADLPIAKAEPVEYVRVCSTYGSGFFYVPGSDTCIKIGGRVRAELVYGETQNTIAFGSTGNLTGTGRRQDAIGFRARGRLDLDVRTPTDWGTVRAFIRYQIDRNTGGVVGTGTGALLDRAFIQFAGFTAGRTQSFFDFYASDLNWGDFAGSAGSDTNINLFAYTATFGSGFSATISLEDRNTRQLNPGVWDTAGQRLPDIVANLRVDQDWGSAQLSGAFHELSSASIYDPLTGVTYPSSSSLSSGVGNWGQRVDTEYGWAIQGGLRFKVPALGAGDVLWLQAAYADGALNYLGLSGSTQVGRVFNTVTDGYIINGDIKTTTGWNITAAGVHYWTPSVRSTLWGSYTDVSYSSAVKWDNANYRDFNVWKLGSALIWSPVRNFDIGVEVLYGRLERDRFRAVDFNQPFYVKRSEDQIQTRLRLQRDF
ncbi:porin [Pseudochelatococcus sp. B33]